MRSKPFPLLSFRTHIALVFGALVIVVAGALTFVQGQMLTTQIQRDTGGALSVIARNASQTLADGLFDRSREVQVLTESAAICAGGLDGPEVAPNLARTTARPPNGPLTGRAREPRVHAARPRRQDPTVAAGRVGHPEGRHLGARQRLFLHRSVQRPSDRRVRRHGDRDPAVLQ